MELNFDREKQSEHILYYILTEKKIYSGLQDLLDFMLKVIVRSYNECVIEGMCNVLQNHDSVYRPLSHETAKAECFIAKNCPPAVMAKSLLTAALDKHFEKIGYWNFHSKAQYLGKLRSDFESTVIKRKVKEAALKSLPCYM